MNERINLNQIDMSVEKFNEAEMIEILGKEIYIKFCVDLGKDSIESDEFKNFQTDKKWFVATTLHHVNKSFFMMVTHCINRRKLPKIDFAIISTYASTSEKEIMDKYLDIYNIAKGANMKPKFCKVEVK